MRNIYFCVCFFSFLTLIYAKGLAKSDCLEKEKALALLETAEILLSKAENSFPSCKEDFSSSDESECGTNKSLAYIEVSKKLISDVRENFPKCPKDDKPKEKDDKPKEKDDKPRDCSEILASGRNKSGVYTIWLKDDSATEKSLKVYCDMETDEEGWTVIQRRGKFPVQQDFSQDWESYKNGFGNLTQEFWLGNEYIRILCHNGCQIRFDLQDKDGSEAFALYESFNLSKNYTIHISNYSGTAGDSMKYQNDFGFSTKDKGDIEKVKQYPGGWWYDSSMINNNLNGIYKPGEKVSNSVTWYQWRLFQNLARVEIKVKPK